MWASRLINNKKCCKHWHQAGAARCVGSSGNGDTENKTKHKNRRKSFPQILQRYEELGEADMLLWELSTFEDRLFILESTSVILVIFRVDIGEEGVDVRDPDTDRLLGSDVLYVNDF